MTNQYVTYYDKEYNIKVNNLASFLSQKWVHVGVVFLLAAVPAGLQAIGIQISPEVTLLLATLISGTAAHGVSTYVSAPNTKAIEQNTYHGILLPVTTKETKGV